MIASSVSPSIRYRPRRFAPGNRKTIGTGNIKMKILQSTTAPSDHPTSYSPESASSHALRNSAFTTALINLAQPPGPYKAGPRADFLEATFTNRHLSRLANSGVQ
ncbi:hypothetical protein BV22DRAFT_295286 [Leucogyrophana mollusca]|uniref:Uncharacterized protein n=1 Tax=Leucogyrophana mollusca TaxID=85980 RepID=A0ACB8BNW8_9AGAM|nr:hypothetical protein BV22DRAFT_295286 [Leucogyrophana mollusca]